MCWLDPNAMFSKDEYLVDGEELFIIDGSLFLENEEYKRWDWMRFPAGGKEETRSLLKAGGAGAQVYRKTGHLSEKALAMEKIQISEDDWEGRDVVMPNFKI